MSTYLITARKFYRYNTQYIHDLKFVFYCRQRTKKKREREKESRKKANKKRDKINDNNHDDDDDQIKTLRILSVSNISPSLTQTLFLA